MTTEPGRVKPRIRKRTWLLLSLGAVTLVAVVWSALGGWDRTPLPEPPPLPVPNGYDDVLEAGREIEKSELVGAKFDLTKSDQAALEPVVQGCALPSPGAETDSARSFRSPWSTKWTT